MEVVERGGAKAPGKVLRANLARSAADGGFFGLMVGLGETYIPAFALAIGMGEVVSGWIVSIPILLGGLLQTISPWAIRRLGSYQRWVVLACTVQALMFVPLLIAALYGSIDPLLLFLVVSCYWGAGMSGGPAWSAWITQLVPGMIRSRFFGRRGRWLQLATMVGFLIGGFILSFSASAGRELQGFAILFALAGLSRLASVLFLSQHQAPIDRGSKAQVAGAAQVLDRVERPESMKLAWRLILFLVSMQAFVQFSGPFFIPYMLKQLHLTYGEFTLLVAAALGGKAIASPIWGALAKRWGGMKLLVVGAIGVVPLASLWTLSNDHRWIFFVQALSGVLWAGYELGFQLVFLNQIPQTVRAKVLTRFNLANSIAWCGGSMLGGWLLWKGAAAFGIYHQVFLISTLGRLLCLVLLWNLVRTPGSMTTDSVQSAKPLSGGPEGDRRSQRRRAAVTGAGSAA